jgi:hypothetical protein
MAKLFWLTQDVRATIKTSLVFYTGGMVWHANKIW